MLYRRLFYRCAQPAHVQCINRFQVCSLCIYSDECHVNFVLRKRNEVESPAKKDSQRSREEGRCRFLVRDCLVNDIEFITSVKYEESVWMEEGGEIQLSIL